MSNKIEEQLFRGLFKPEDDPTWFIALWEAEQMVECNRLKDWAAFLQNDWIGTKNLDVQEWLDDQAEAMEQEGDSLLDIILAKMEEWGFTK